jgi:hypothetical protein
MADRCARLLMLGQSGTSTTLHLPSEYMSDVYMCMSTEAATRFGFGHHTPELNEVFINLSRASALMRYLLDARI